MALGLTRYIPERGSVGCSGDLAPSVHMALGLMRYIPERGSVGCSGDLAPSAHMALGLMGEGMMWNPKTLEYVVILRFAID